VQPDGPQYGPRVVVVNGKRTLVNQQKGKDEKEDLSKGGKPLDLWQVGLGLEICMYGCLAVVRWTIVRSAGPLMDGQRRCGMGHGVDGPWCR